MPLLSCLFLGLAMLLSALNLKSLATEKNVPAHYSVTNWPNGLRIDELHILLQYDIAMAAINGAALKPYIPLDQLARFLNDHVQGSVENIAIMGGKGLEDEVPRLLDEVTVPGRLHVDLILFDDFFHLPWADIKRILDGRTLRAKAIAFTDLQLPSSVDSNKLLKLPAVRECSRLFVDQLPGSPPLFDNTALMEWLEQSDDRLLLFDSDCVSSGLLSFLDALKKNFHQATQAHTYSVQISCPSFNGVTGGLGVRDEELSNRLGEKMEIKVVADPTATEGVEHPFEALHVTRIHNG